MHFDWQELSRGLRRQNLLYHDDLVNESDFAYLIKCRFQDLVEEIKTAEHREDSVLKTKLKARLSNLCNLCQKLNLQLTNYDDLFDGQIEVRWRNAPRGNTVVILPPKPVPAR
jgi:siderophore synthetase component